MYKILKLNEISKKGLALFPQDKYEIKTEISDPLGIILRSFNMHNMSLQESVIAVGRAGIGVDNIPVEKYSEKGVVVFNTPGASANAVKEIILTALFLASRDIAKGISFAKSLEGQGDVVPELIEKNKKNYEGVEIAGKTLGVVGLGNIGIVVANGAISLGMNVIGYDPFISVESAWKLSQKVQRAGNLDELIVKSDYITLHFPLTDKTRGMINTEKFSHMKKGVRLLNFSRGEIVDQGSLMVALMNGTVKVYVTDFPNDELIRMENVIPLPHLGASTQEARDNCAVMISKQMCDFLENGNIKNSVNYPDCQLEQSSDFRLATINKNIPNIVGQVSTILAGANVNISEMLNKSKGDYACTIIDVSDPLTEEIAEAVRNINGVLKVRFLRR